MLSHTVTTIDSYYSSHGVEVHILVSLLAMWDHLTSDIVHFVLQLSSRGVRSLPRMSLQFITVLDWIANILAIFPLHHVLLK